MIAAGARRAAGALALALIVSAASPVAAQTTLENTVTVESGTPALENSLRLFWSDSFPHNQRVEALSHVVQQATVVSNVVTSADLGLEKTVEPSQVVAGGTAVFELVATNEGPSNAQDLTITDVLPAALEFLSATTSAGASCTTPPVGLSGTVECTWAGATGVGVMRTLEILVAIPASAGDQTIDNLATVSSPTTSDPVDANDDAQAQLVVAAAPAVTEIPTLDGLALLVLGLLLAGGGILALRRMA